jgi:hypothetical protein
MDPDERRPRAPAMRRSANAAAAPATRRAVATSSAVSSGSCRSARRSCAAAPRCSGGRLRKMHTPQPRGSAALALRSVRSTALSGSLMTARPSLRSLTRSTCSERAASAMPSCCSAKADAAACATSRLLPAAKPRPEKTQSMPPGCAADRRCSELRAAAGSAAVAALAAAVAASAAAGAREAGAGGAHDADSLARCSAGGLHAAAGCESVWCVGVAESCVSVACDSRRAIRASHTARAACNSLQCALSRCISACASAVCSLASANSCSRVDCAG